MFNGMMDPELMRIAQEQMSRMSPAEMARIQQQVMSNPELMKMASESMQNFRPEDFKQAAEQLKHISPEEMAEMREKMANASPEELASMRARMDAQVSYEISGAEMLKKQGNEFHSQGKYSNALQKYIHAKKNLKEIPNSKARNISMACSLNMMSCYLKTGQYDECVKEGTEALAYDANNIKALYRRGQAYREMGRLEEAVSDLRKALEVSPEDETIADALREAEERLMKGGGERPSRRGLVIEEITEEATISSDSHENSRSGNSLSPPKETSQSNSIEDLREPCPTNTEHLDSLKDNPESIRSFQNFMSRSDPKTLSALSGGKIEELSPDMVKTASNVIGKMSPDELKRMFELASSFKGESPFSNSGSSFSPGSIPSDLSPDMLKTATDMMGKMSPEELQKMMEMASSLKGPEASPFSAAGLNTGTGSVPPNVTPDMLKMATDMMNKMSPEERQKMFEISASLKQETNGVRTHDSGESSSAEGLNLRSDQTRLQNSDIDLPEQMRNPMKNPAMREMLSTMIKTMDPDTMAHMSEQFGFKLSREDAEKAQQAMSSLSPDALDKMMKWMDRAQRGMEGVRKTKNWLLGRPGMILAILMLLLAVVLHWFGFIGR